MIEFNLAQTKPQRVEYLQITEEAKELLLEQCRTVTNFCPASNHREEHKEIILGNGKLIFEPNEFNEYGVTIVVFDVNTDRWIPAQVGDYLVKRQNGSLTVVSEIVFHKFYTKL